MRLYLTPSDANTAANPGLNYPSSSLNSTAGLTSCFPNNIAVFRPCRAT